MSVIQSTSVMVGDRVGGWAEVENTSQERWIEGVVLGWVDPWHVEIQLDEDEDDWAWADLDEEPETEILLARQVKILKGVE